MRRVRSFAIAFLMALSAAGASTFAQQPRPAAIVGFPPVLEKLQVTAEQRKQIEAIVTKHDALFLAAWQDFSTGYQQTLKAEAVLLAAIEDGFTEAQRQQAHAERSQRIASSAAASPAPASAANNAAASAKTEKSPAGVALTKEQADAIGKLQEKYHVSLGPMTRDIQTCHARMLAIEMEKFLEIQKVLTQEQLTKLSQMLKSGEAAKIAGMIRADGK